MCSGRKTTTDDIDESLVVDMGIEQAREDLQNMRLICPCEVRIEGDKLTLTGLFNYGVNDCIAFWGG